MPRVNPILCMNGIVANINADMIAPEIRPKVKTVFFMMRCLLSDLEKPGAIYVCGFKLSSYFRMISLVSGENTTFALRNQPHLLRDLHGLSASPGAELVEEPAGVSLDRVFADEEFVGDF